ncbi:MAG: hypothetical protein ACK5MQ_12415 [Pikeienuella sp.]
MSDLTYVPREKLVGLINETENTLAELKSELDRREEAGQLREIDRLDEHMESAVISLETIRDFCRTVIEELRGGKNAG